MFNGNKKEKTFTNERIDTLIGGQTKVEGNLTTSDTTHIDGELIGDIMSDGMLIIGETGVVRGNITSSIVLVAGKVHGNLKVSEKLNITSSGFISGEITTKALIIDEGAVFEGSCNMTPITNKPAAEALKSENPSKEKPLEASSPKVDLEKKELNGDKHEKTNLSD